MIYCVCCLNYKHPAINVQWIRLQNAIPAYSSFILLLIDCDHKSVLMPTAAQDKARSTITGNEKEFQHLMFWFNEVCLSPLSVPCL